MHTLIYFSAASYLFSDADLTSILKTSRANNTRQDITGLLLYHDGSILQILEGDQDSVNTLFNKIKKDSRHTQIIKTLDAPIEKKSFPDWSMGFKQISNDNWSELTGYFNLDHKKQLQNISGSESDYIITMIRSFANVNQISL